MPIEPTSQPRAIRTGVLTLMLVAATLLGAWRVSASPAFREDPQSLRVGGATFAVGHVERVTGLTQADLAGMAHGIQGLVRDDSTLIRVSVTISAGSRTTRFDSSRLRLYSSGSSTGRRPLGGSVGRGALHPHASIEGAVSFVVPRDGAGLRLGATASPRRIALVHVDKAPSGAGHMNMKGMNMSPHTPSRTPTGSSHSHPTRH